MTIIYYKIRKAACASREKMLKYIIEIFEGTQTAACICHPGR